MINIFQVDMPTVAILKIVRRPRAARRQTQRIQSEVRSSLQALGATTVKKLQENVADWQSQPKFNAEVAVTTKEWKLSVKVNTKEKIGKIYRWVDEGVGEYGGKEPLPDIHVKKAKYLGFVVPHQPISTPYEPNTGIPSSDPQRFMRRKTVHHPGIYARKFTFVVVEWLKSRKPGAFRSTVEAAVKRALRKQD